MIENENALRIRDGVLLPPKTATEKKQHKAMRNEKLYKVAVLFGHFTIACIKYFFSVPSDARALMETSLRNGLFVACGATLISNLNLSFASWIKPARNSLPSIETSDIDLAKSGFKRTKEDLGAAFSPTAQKRRVGLMLDNEPPDFR